MGGPVLLQCFTWPAQEVNNMCPSPLPSYRSWLCRIWLQKPGLWGDHLFKSWDGPIGSVLLQLQAKLIKFISRFGLELWKLSDLPARDAAILQVGTKTASNQRPFRFQTQLFNCINGQIRAGVAGRQFQPECYCYSDRTATCCVWTWNRTGVVRS